MTTRSGKIELEWADLGGAGAGGKHVFRLPIAQLEELQEKCDAGPQQILRRLYDGAWRTYDVRETLRLGLIGGGMASLDAAKMVERYAGDGNLLENVIIAQAVLAAALAGVPDEPLKKKRSRKTPEPEATTPEASSNSPPSTSSGPH